ncbi:GerMN domain-containing protein [Bacillaceae bacterium S4-13-56]
MISPTLFLKDNRDDTVQIHNDTSRLSEESLNHTGPNQIGLSETDAADESILGGMGIMGVSPINSHLVTSNLSDTAAVQYVFPSKDFLYNVPATVISTSIMTKEEVYHELNKDQSELLEQWGLMESFLKGITFTLDQDLSIVHVQVPQSFFASSGSYVEDALIRSLHRMFGNTRYKTILFQNENGESGVDFPHAGPMKEVKIQQPDKEIYFLYKIDEKAMGMLVPMDTEIDNIEDNISELTSPEDYSLLQSIIPEDVEINRVEPLNEETLIVEFSQGTTLLANQENLTMIEGILLTARSFGYETVQFSNAGLKKLSNYDLTNPIPVPSDQINPIYLP